MEPDAARAALTDGLTRQGLALSEPARAAFARVPRHLFVPEVDAATAYADEALVVKSGPDGTALSSSSQPTMMAIMLSQLGLAPGHRVLEIGTGTGYNAAVMQEVVGRSGAVVSVEFDAELAQRAGASLRAAGYDAVTVRCSDGGYGDPGAAPFDRVLVTAGAYDVAPAWLDQLVPGGVLVLPLSVRGIQVSVALTGSGPSWASASACRCSFVPMMGAFAGPEAPRRIGGDPQLVAGLAGGVADDAQLRAVLAAAGTGWPLPVRSGPAGLSDLDMWLTLTAGPDTGRLSVTDAPSGWLGGGPPPPCAGLLRLAGGEPGFAVVVPGPGLRAFGPGGAALAADLAARSAQWQRSGRPGADRLRLTYARAGQPLPAGVTALTRPAGTIGIRWDA